MKRYDQLPGPWQLGCIVLKNIHHKEDQELEIGVDANAFW